MKTKLQRRLLLATLCAALSLAAMAPGAQADFAFAPGSVFAKGHTPTTQVPHVTMAGQGTLFPYEVEPWRQAILDAPEPTQAGGHPDFTTSFRFAPGEHPDNVKDIVADTPAGAVGNPLAAPRCELADFYGSQLGNCSTESQLGVVAVRSGPVNFLTPISSLVPPPGEAAMLGFKALSVTGALFPSVRSDGDYGLRVTTRDIEPSYYVEWVTLTFWGIPHDPVHDGQRMNRTTGTWGAAAPGAAKPFLSAPTDCSSGALGFTIKARSWQALWAGTGAWIEEPDPAPEPTGCDQVPFEPSVAARPSTPVADSPSGLEVDVHMPQNNESCKQIKPFPAPNESQYDCGLATSHLKDTTVTLPAGLSINPSGANGLDACTTAQIGLSTPIGVSPQHFSAQAPHCPDASRVGTVEVDTPLLEAPAPGSVYIAKPYDNPFGSLLAIYIVVEDAERNFIAKLAGEVHADPVTGQLTTTVTDAPQLPFEHFYLHFKQGPHATLRTPSGCGEYTSTAALTPYSQPATAFERQDSWSIEGGPSGGCETPNSPSLDAGSVSPLAGTPTPTVVDLSRADGTQEFSTVKLTLPPGLTGKLAGVGQCPDSALAAAEAKSGHEEQASPSCPANSRIGTVYVAAGAGPSPYHTTATAYLAGPYKGAPASIAIVAPATAGPFDLGTVVVRVALRLDQSTGQITAESDPIPHILEGIPLDVRSTKIVMDRPDFTRNGTSCDPSSFSGEEVSLLGQAASLSERFQLAECVNLPFKPKLGIRLYGGTKRGAHPALRGVLRMPEGGANTAKASVALPHSEFLDQGHIGTVCTRVQFAEGDGNGSAYPPGSVYGHAVARSPLVDYPVEGPAILRSSSHELPDLVVALHGPPSQPVQFDVIGRVDSIHGGIRTSFEGVPDLPVSSFVLSMKGGKKGLLQNSTNICQGVHRVSAEFDGQNGKARYLRPKLRNAKCAKHGHHRKKHRRHSHRRPTLRRLRAVR